MRGPDFHRYPVNLVRCNLRRIRYSVYKKIKEIAIIDHNLILYRTGMRIMTGIL